MTDSFGGRYGGPNPVGGSEANWRTPGEHQGRSHPPPPVPPPGLPGFGSVAAGQQNPRIRRSPKRLWLALAAGGAVIAVIAVVAVTVLNGHGSAGSPTDAVKGYLEALARGDAEAALSFSDDRPADTEFLTTDILKQQISKLPITDIQVKDQPAPGDPKTRIVHAAAKFGDQTSRVVITPKRRNGRWYLSSAVLKMHPTPNATASANTVTLFGKPVGDSVHYVFPGWLAVGSSNPYLEVQATPQLLNGLDTDSVVLQTNISMSEAGTKAVNDALVAVFAKCEQSHELKPAYPCSEIGLDPAQAVDGTVQWGHADLSTLTQGFDVTKLSVNIVGFVDIPVTAQLKSGGTAQFTGRHSVTGTADLSKVPPELRFP